MSAATATATDLKRLAFVQTSTAACYSEAERIYGLVRSMAVPEFARERLAAMEDRLAATTAPYVSRAQDQALQALQRLDAHADALATAHATNLTAFRSASESWFSYMSGMADHAVERLMLVKDGSLASVTAGREALHAALAQARAALPGPDPKATVELAWAAWSKFISLPAVTRLLQNAEPAAVASTQAFYRLHDQLVAAPLYKNALASAAGTISYATTTTPYKLLYPWIKPVAEPALARVTSNERLKSLMEYWKPSEPQLALEPLPTAAPESPAVPAPVPAAEAEEMEVEEEIGGEVEEAVEEEMALGEDEPVAEAVEEEAAEVVN